MLQNLTNIAKTAAAFLQTGKAPPNTPENLRQILENENHLASKKFFIIFTSILMLAVFYYSTVFLLSLFKMPEHITAFVTIFSKTIEVFAIIIASYLGVQAVVDLKYNSDSRAEIKGDVQVIKEEVHQILTQNTKEEDYIIE